MKHLVLFDILQQKRVGGYFNDFTYAQKDKLPDEKGLTCVVSGNDGLFVAVGGENGNLYILKNWLVYVYIFFYYLDFIIILKKVKNPIKP